MNNNKLEIATFAAGCFWGVQADFDKIPGVVSTEAGYSGGNLPSGGENPNYEEVCTGKTGHAESVKVEYDSALVSYEKLLEEFWKMHDPTTADRQGPDVGSQYRSVIFYNTPEQKEAAEKSKEEKDASGIFDSPIVTQIVQVTPFYRAEEYHQKYFEKTGRTVC